MRSLRDRFSSLVNLHQLIALSLIVFIVAPLWAAEGEAAGPKAKLDDKSDEVLRAFSAYMQKAGNFSFSLKSTMNITMAGTTSENALVHSLTVQRPDKIAIRKVSGEMGLTLISDGKNVLKQTLGDKQTVEPAPESLPDLLGNPDTQMLLTMVSGGLPIALVLVQDDIYKQMLEQEVEVTYGGKEELEGVACHHLQFQTKDLDWEMWIQDGETPVLVQAVPDTAKAMSKLGAGQMPPGSNVAMKANLADWKVNAELPADTFTVSEPVKSSAVNPANPNTTVDTLDPNDIVEKLNAYSGTARLGEVAPDTELFFLNGTSKTLSSHKDQVIVMDFWATWCPPCRAGLPVLNEVAQLYQDKNVAFYIVNIKEKPTDIARFLTQNNLTLTAALDPKAQIGRQFGVRGIPQTVLIGKDGTVQSIHVGIPGGDVDGLRATLTQEIDALLAGKQLAKAN